MIAERYFFLLLSSKLSIMAAFLFIVCVLVISPSLSVIADLRVGFYDATCPKAESIVRQVVENRFRTDPSITPALLRMHFHDCFVRVSFFFLV